MFCLIVVFVGLKHSASGKLWQITLVKKNLVINDLLLAAFTSFDTHAE
uniref:Uncharacterized protein n=1 Tax=Rhizophora mucronata TaxID=61149 RepID=A0A2P2NQ58_RHIMU